MRVKTIGSILTTWLLVTAISASPAGAQQNGEAEVMLQAAMQKEQVEGRLELAIELYQAIVDRHGNNHAVAARALFYLGRSYEKLGNAEAQNAYARLLEDYADQRDMAAAARSRLETLAQQTTPTEESGVVVRRVWSGRDVDVSSNLTGTVTPDGRYLSFVDWTTGGDIAVRDLTTGENRRLTGTAGPGYAFGSAISLDGQQIAYVWWDFTSEPPFADLRVASVTPAGDLVKPRVLYRNEDVYSIEPRDWSPDGKLVLATFTRNDRTTQIVLVSTTDGSVLVLKTLDWRLPVKMSFSPDGQYIVYDFPTTEDAPERDLFVLATDGSRETRLVTHPANDWVLGWARDGNQILFASDRTGSTDAWVVSIAEGRPQGSPRLIKADIGNVRPLGLTRNGSFYYGVGRGGVDVYVGTLDLATGESLTPPEQIGRFTGKNYGPDWSPDGQYLAYLSSRDPVPSTGFESSGWVLVIRSVETGEERELPLKLTTKPFRPRWSPDGGSLLATTRDHKGRQGVYRIDAQTGEVKPIVQMGPEATTSWADWSPDGKAIFYVSSDHASRRARLLMRNLETGQEKEIALGPAFGWAGSVLRSPDGWQLAFRESLMGGLKVISATGESRELLRFSQEEQEQGIQIGGVTWMPDGRHLLFSKGLRGNMELWRIPVDGGEPAKLGLAMVGLGLKGLSVHPDGQRIAFSAGGGVGPTSALWVMENFLHQVAGNN